MGQGDEGMRMALTVEFSTAGKEQLQGSGEAEAQLDWI